LGDYPEFGNLSYVIICVRELVMQMSREDSSRKECNKVRFKQEEIDVEFRI
jgi:hypothetical protein